MGNGKVHSLMLLLFYHMTYTTHNSKCVRTEPLQIPHEWYEPGELLIGAVVTHVGGESPQISFEKHPSQESTNLL